MSTDDTRDTDLTKRWRESGSPLAGMSEALETLGSQRAGTEEIARLQVRLAPLLAASPGHVSAARQASRWRSTSAAGWSAGVLLTGAMLWTWTQSGAPQATSHTVPAVVVPAAPQPTLPPTVTPPVAGEPSTPATAPSAAPTATARPSPKISARAKVAVPANEAPSNPEAELALLRSAQSALNRSASAALRVLDEHEQLYPQGLFVQEREMLRIEAELTLGHREQALQRARQFSERFGASTYRTRIDALIAKPNASKDRETEAQEGTP